MPLIEHEGKRPTLGPDCRIAPTATIVGDVTIGAGCSVGYNAVVVAESGPVTIGAGCVIMDGAVLRGTAKTPLTIGDHVLIGAHASLVVVLWQTTFSWRRMLASSMVRTSAREAKSR